ncbi:YbhB/YbcL family Raf kinase inhibitor-like protein [Pandoraea nosoerga]|uniref:Lipoprotein LppC n=1 Tax=Pandoraea nosoerga TaxID=2508296 RepID=A0A5E4V134_9BURK|nr:YbhB/YbcL family Raf kinase inhibitor-like protein [Pandoraea nosoerga]MBN4667488.1 YbhB/YbcL family Raf kinase inhibitor-like protein [Pandoraea nosoerga]MBN4676471.1 YbhB/YbcL family Raf kinase inhibitor-like protein [Pandoraea nosoerga]MBN4682284.1 YbhB/YbcL family Raf kinase inhibitor-like protein [Pandoraea nosoerga]MBN4745749.1 YbhB/YbcL family Raf kinase inhibitor-like protein [Pandoraea nosoerga]VVE04835.1 Putative lipoprotein LppC [Pandoraea nosoerga]
MNRLFLPIVCRLAGAPAIAAMLGAGAAHAEGMSVSSSAFADNGMLPAVHAGAGECGGQNMSPPIAWKNLPQATRSVVITMKDPDGAKGGGVVHWAVYNVPATVSSLAAGAANETSEQLTVGKNVSGAMAYRGACPPLGDTPHHYIITVTATDLEPGRLPPGLDAAGLALALAGHTLSGSTIVARYAR